MRVKLWLDRITGIVPMYRLVLLSLLLVGATAVVLSVFGRLSDQPPALIASAVVAVAVTFGTGWGVASVMRTRFHPESSLITGLLVFMILDPSLDPGDLLVIALASALASVSKYLLAVRGRHIFNPAAAGSFVVAATGLGFANWWIGTPYLQPVIIILAFVVLYRIRRLTMATIFVSLAAVIRIGITMTSGGSIEEALSFTLLSSPLFFFAGFMLSEPLTMPPRRWQQAIVAVVVAVIFSVPFSIGDLYSDPLLALLVGNAVAFGFGQRRSIRMTYLGRTQLAPSTWELAFQPDRPVRFSAGQYMELTIDHRKADFRGTRRFFTISSPPGRGPLTFAITVAQASSSFKNALLELEPGAVVRGTGVGGDFSLPRDSSEPLLLVAGGIGITPFASQLAAAIGTGQRRDVVVAYGTSSDAPLPYGDLLQKSGARVVLFGPKPAGLPEGWKHGGEGRMTGERLAAVIPDISKRRAFISGPPAMVDDMRGALRTLGSRRIKTDHFSGY